MDNIVFVPSTHELEWVQDVLPGTSPAELPIAGRRIIDYAIETAQKAGVMFTEVLDWRFSQKLADDFAVFLASNSIYGDYCTLYLNKI